MEVARYDVGVLGLGYVGLPLALAFGSKMPTLGFDIASRKIEAYRRRFDPTHELDEAEFTRADRIFFSDDAAQLKKCKAIVVAVPTPVTKANQPDFAPLLGASEIIGRNISKGTVVIFESTVYPGATEQICGPVIERVSGLKRGQDFFLGYSPERVNPGDREHTVRSIIKVVAGENAEVLERVAALYGAIVDAGVYRAPSIAVAEAAKVIENTQRDLNIALMNELSIIFHRLGIDTEQVLRTAGTKWNFLPFKPGLVGGHCIGVDPYYLTHCAQLAGYHPEVILAGRRINDTMASFAAQEFVKALIHADIGVRGARVLVMGVTFKENCSDLRNSKVAELILNLKEFGLDVLVWDPVANAEEARHEYGIELIELEQANNLSGIVAAVSHREIASLSLEQLASRMIKPNAPFMDLKWTFDPAKTKQAGFCGWRL